MSSVIRLACKLLSNEWRSEQTCRSQDIVVRLSNRNADSSGEERGGVVGELSWEYTNKVVNSTKTIRISCYFEKYCITPSLLPRVLVATRIWHHSDDNTPSMTIYCRWGKQLRTRSSARHNSCRSHEWVVSFSLRSSSRLQAQIIRNVSNTWNDVRATTNMFSKNTNSTTQSSPWLSMLTSRICRTSVVQDHDLFHHGEQFLQDLLDEVVSFVALGAYLGLSDRQVLTFDQQMKTSNFWCWIRRIE